MVKGLFAGLAGLSAAIAAFQLQSDGGAGAGASTASQDAPGNAPSIAGRAASDAGFAGPAADAGNALVRAPVPDAGIAAAAPTDGGPLYVGDAPGRLRSEAVAGAADAGSADRGAQAGSADQAEEVRRLRERVARLEQELARSRSDAQTQELERLNQQVASLRDQLAQEQARRQAEELAAQQAKAREQEGAAALAAAQQKLATGDYRALDLLESSAGSFPAPVQGAVNSARAAVQNGDLAMARYWLSVAQAEERKRLNTPSR
jgi:hypothetical protein